MYQLNKDSRSGLISSVNKKNEDGSGWSIPFDPANTDYQTFKRDLAEGVELQDPEGNLMTQEQVDEFLRTIP